MKKMNKQRPSFGEANQYSVPGHATMVQNKKERERSKRRRERKNQLIRERMNAPERFPILTCQSCCYYTDLGGRIGECLIEAPGVIAYVPEQHYCGEYDEERPS